MSTILRHEQGQKHGEFPQIYVLQIFVELLTIMHIFCKFIITLQYFHSDNMVIVDDVQESDSTTVSGINVRGESMPSTVCAEVANTGEESEIISLQSHWYQASIPEEEISIWVDEMEKQNFKRQKSNEAAHSILGGRYSPVMSTLNTTWDDVSDTQQRYYIRKGKEAVATALSVITPGQEESIGRC